MLASLAQSAGPECEPHTFEPGTAQINGTSMVAFNGEYFRLDCMDTYNAGTTSALWLCMFIGILSVASNLTVYDNAHPCANSRYC